MQTVKHLIKNVDDPFTALLSYRVTPLPWCGRSPAELLMGRMLRSSLPQTTASLTPQWSYLEEFRTANQKYKEQQKKNFDDRHRVHSLPEIPDNSDVWITTDNCNISGKTVHPADTPRSYIIRTPTGELRRNRSQINVNPSVPVHDLQPTITRPRSPIQTRSRTKALNIPPGD